MNPGDPLPDGWRWTTLEDVAQITVSSVDKKTKAGEIPVRLCNYTDVYYNRFIDSDIEFMSATATEREIAKFRLKVGDVLMTKDSDIGVPSLVNEIVPDLICGYHVAIMRPTPDIIDSGYLLYALNSDPVQYQIHARASGMTILGLRKSDMVKVQIPLPPLAEQRHITDQMGMVERARRAAASQLASIEDLSTALLKKVFERDATIKSWRRVEIFEPPLTDGWRWTTLDDVIETISPPGKIQARSYQKEGKYPVIDQSPNLSAGRTDDESILIDGREGLVIFGDHTCVVKFVDYRFAQGADGIKIFRTKNGLLPKFAYLHLLSYPITQTGYKRHFRELRKSRIVIPDIDTQQRIVAALDIVEHAQRAARAQLTAIDALGRAMLRRLLAPATS